MRPVPETCKEVGCSRYSIATGYGNGYCILHQRTEAAVYGNSVTGFDPSLEGRKNDKVRMDLVMTGFPLALMEMGKCMTWALTKGYKVDDWHNVPDPVRAYTGAAMRHLLKEMGGETHDDESKLLHAVHTAWNAMARLEMILRGKTL